MRAVKKAEAISLQIINKNAVMAALEIYAYASSIGTGLDQKVELGRKTKNFSEAYRQSYYDVIDEIWRSNPDFPSDVKKRPWDELYNDYVAYISKIDSIPTKLATYYLGRHTRDAWVFKGYVYEVEGDFSDDEIMLLIMEDFDKELEELDERRRYFENLRAKFFQNENADPDYIRQRIPESIRVEVWRRDGGKCARCGSRENLEYDHIVPISKGGNNTARNIELLCEKCNRSKSNKVV